MYYLNDFMGLCKYAFIQARIMVVVGFRQKSSLTIVGLFSDFPRSLTFVGLSICLLCLMDNPGLHAYSLHVESVCCNYTYLI